MWNTDRMKFYPLTVCVVKKISLFTLPYGSAEICTFLLQNQKESEILKKIVGLRFNIKIPPFPN